MEEEIWKDIPEFEGYYQVSSIGRVRRIRPNMSCGIDVVNYISIKKPKNKRAIVTLSVKTVFKATVLATLVHDTFYPDRKGLKYKLKDGDINNVVLENFILLDYPRWKGKGENLELTRRIQKLKNINKKSIKEIAEVFNITDNTVRYHLGKQLK